MTTTKMIRRISNPAPAAAPAYSPMPAPPAPLALAPITVGPCVLLTLTVVVVVEVVVSCEQVHAVEMVYAMFAAVTRYDVSRHAPLGYAGCRPHMVMFSTIASECQECECMS